MMFAEAGFLLGRARKVLKTTGNRKYICPGLIIAIATLDPDPTMVTEILVGIPLIILMEISVIIARRFERQMTL